ncbi:glycosyltransferase family 1 protein, partial [Enterococcus faecium]|nr:glycosyltransferase family 1 protein [Enterococcus faecium]
MEKTKIKHVYIIGSKGIPAKYGGFESFVENLTKRQTNKTIQYHIACMTENSLKS